MIDIETKRKLIAWHTVQCSIGCIIGVYIFPSLKNSKKIESPKLPKELIEDMYNKAKELISDKTDKEINILFNDIYSIDTIKD